MSARITLGTKEYLNAEVTDETGSVTDLVAAGATGIKFDVRDKDKALIITDQAATASGMVIQCLVDTSGWTNSGVYYLYPKFTLGSEVVVLGPEECYAVL